MRPSSARLISRWIASRSHGLIAPIQRSNFTEKWGCATVGKHRGHAPAISSLARGFASREDVPEKQISLYDRVVGDERLRRLGRSISAVGGALNSVYGRLSPVYTRIAQTRYGRLMRLDKPVGTHLLFLPGAWGIAIGATSAADVITLTGLFYAGAVVMRGAGCTINDIWDVDIDRQVERTKSRPIAGGEVSTSVAFVLLGGQLLGGLGVLTQLNTASFLTGSLLVLPVLFYPLAKRRTAYPQAVLGLTFNGGALLGFCAATGGVGVPALWLYAAGWCWTMVYDTIYAAQDRADDSRAGVHSTALTFGARTKPVLAVLTGAKLAALTGAGLAADLSLPYFMGATAAALHLGHQVHTTNLDDKRQCQAAFESNQMTGAITWFAILAGRLF